MTYLILTCEKKIALPYWDIFWKKEKVYLLCVYMYMLVCIYNYDLVS